MNHTNTHLPSTAATGPSAGLKTVAAVVMGMASTLALAQDGQSNPDGALKLGDGVLFYPSVKLSAGHDDNVRATQANAISSAVTTLAPNLKTEIKRSSGLYTLIYAGSYTRYSDASDDAADNHDLNAAGAHVFSARSRLNWNLGYQDRVDARADAVAASADPDHWRGNSLNALYSYGAKQAQGRLETEYTYNNKRYQNNLATTAGSDVDTHQVAGRYFWRVMPRTYLVAEARVAQAQYRVGTYNDNTDTRLLAGATWEATAKTTGSVKLGQQKKNFDLGSKADASGATYEASVEWKPLSYSVFTLVANRSVFDALSDGDYDRNTSLGLTWGHQWNAALSSRVSVRDASSDFVNSARQDDTLTTSLGVSYGLSRRYTLGLDVAHTQRDSTLAPNNYKRNTVLVSLNAAL
jgi:hypothetical protein